VECQNDHTDIRKHGGGMRRLLKRERELDKGVEGVQEE